MKIENHKLFKSVCMDILRQSISEDYIEYIYTAISDDLIDDVEATCDAFYSRDEIRFAIGRVLCNRLEIEV